MKRMQGKTTSHKITNVVCFMLVMHLETVRREIQYVNCILHVEIGTFHMNYVIIVRENKSYYHSIIYCAIRYFS